MLKLDKMLVGMVKTCLDDGKPWICITALTLFESASGCGSVPSSGIGKGSVGMG